MNKKISIVIVGFLLLFPALPLSAQSTTHTQISELLNQISNLTKLVQELQKQLIALQSSEIDEDFVFSVDLKIEDKNEHVKMLQKVLNREGFTVAEYGPGSMGNETNYFGNLTKDAVEELQKQYASEILVPQYKLIADGVVEKNTRKVLNRLISGEQKPPVISAISPNSGENGSKITIIGENFNVGENTIITSVGEFTASSLDGKSLIFEIRVPFAGIYSSDLQTELGLDKQFEDLFAETDFEQPNLGIDFPVQMSVKNADLESNVKVFNIKF